MTGDCFASVIRDDRSKGHICDLSHAVPCKEKRPLDPRFYFLWIGKIALKMRYGDAVTECLLTIQVEYASSAKKEL